MKKLLFILICFLPITVFSQNSAETDTSNEKIFTYVEEMPEFPGGDEALFKYLAQSIKYPKGTADAKIQGRVYITFVISKEGKTEQVKVMRGIGTSFDQEAIRVIEEMPNWKPGTQNGKAVNVQYSLPINFKLD